MREQHMEPLQRSVCGLEKEIRELREQQTSQLTLLARIETMLSERSSIWDRSFLDVRSDVESLKKRIWTITGAAAALSAVGSQLLSKFF